LCDDWYIRLGALGFRRIGKMHGGTNDDDRSRLLADWKADKLDIVVATSAFGLGVDKQNVRTVIHAQCPESVDRFYQDVGRSGRDGQSSVSLLVTTPEDWAEVSGIGKPKFISAQIGLDRWKRMYQERKTLETTPQTILVDLNAARRLDMRGDYNRNWNVRTLQLLQRAGALEFVSHDEEDYDHAAVQPSTVPHTDPKYWNDTITPLRRELISDYQQTRRLLNKLLKPSITCIGEQFKICYASKSFGIEVITACGGCPACRANGVEPTCGKIIARRIPAGPLPGVKLGKELLRLLADKQVALIGYPPRCEETELGEVLSELLWWLASQGVRNFVAQGSIEATLRDLVTNGRHLTCFHHQHPPRLLDVTALQPTAVVLTRPEPTWWKDFHGKLHSLSAPTILIAPSDLQCPDDPGRKVSDVLDGFSIELTAWEHQFVA
jgi:ATP-dependent DNA helicase RecQ